MDRKLATITLAAFLLALVFPSVNIMTEGKEQIRFFLIKEGNITSNETWSGDIYLKDVIIKEGITVKIESGTNITCAYSASLIVEGNLNVNGSKTQKVDIISENTNWPWDGIIIYPTGSVNMQNFSIKDACHPFYKSIITGLGGKSIILNGTIEGKFSGLCLTSSGGYNVGPLTINKCEEPLKIYSNNALSKFKDLTFNYCRGPIIIRDSRDILISRIKIIGTTGMMGLSYSSNITLNHFYGEFIPYIDDNQTSIFKGSGISLIGEINNFSFNDIELINVTSGLYVFYGDVNNTVITNMRLKSDSTNAFKAGVRKYYPNKIKLKFINCSLSTSGSFCSIQDDDPYDNFTNHFDIDLINSTYNKKVQIGNIAYSSTGFINISWYIDISVKNSKLIPQPSTLLINGTVIPDDRLVYLNNGVGSKLLMKYKSITPDSISAQRYNLTILPNNHWSEGNIYSQMTFAEYTFFQVQINLKPISTFPKLLLLNEDSQRFVYLNGSFSDPDGDTLTYRLESGPNISIKLEMELDWIGISISTGKKDWSGTSWLKINAIDAGGKSNFTNSTIIVTPVYDPPRLVMPLSGYIINEEDYVVVNLSGVVQNIDGENITWTGTDTDYYGLLWIEENALLKVNPKKDWYGFISLPLTYSDGIGLGLTFLNITVLPVNDPPQNPAKILYDPEIVFIDEKITFRTGPVLDIDSSNLTYIWDFGDNISKKGIEVDHTFKESGVYNISLIVWDGELYSDWTNIILEVKNRTTENETVELSNIQIIKGDEYTIFNIKATKHCILYLILEFKNSSIKSYLMKEEPEGNYTVIIPNTEAKEIVTYWISVKNSGEPLDGKKRTDLPDYKERDLSKQKQNLILIIIVIIVVIILMAVIISLYLSIKRNKMRENKKSKEETKKTEIMNENQFITTISDNLITKQEPPSIHTHPSIEDFHKIIMSDTSIPDLKNSEIDPFESDIGKNSVTDQEILIDEMIQELLERNMYGYQSLDKNDIIKRLKTFKDDGNISEEEYMEIVMRLTKDSGIGIT